MSIIIEGPDGGGKSTLIETLTKELKLPLHSRHCTSDEGPIDNLFDWAHADVATWELQKTSIYDRHPYISEYIYAGLLRGGVAEEFLSITAQQDIDKMARDSLVVFCIPSLDTIAKNIEASHQMDGVAANVENLYWAYREAHANWRGNKIFYDYEITPLDSVIYQAKSFLIGRNK